MARLHALVLRFKDETKKVAFLKRRSLLRGLEGENHYLNDDLTLKQVDHRKEHMPRVTKAREERKVFYKDRRVYIGGKAVP